jgi:HEAT repeat protein
MAGLKYIIIFGILLLAIAAAVMITSSYDKEAAKIESEIDDTNKGISKVEPKYATTDDLKAAVKLAKEDIDIPGTLAKLYDDDIGIRTSALQKAIVYLHVHSGDEKGKELISEALPVIKEKLNDADANVREKSAWVLRYLRPVAAEAIPELIKATYDDSKGVVLEAIPALGNVGPDAREALPRLKELAETSPLMTIKDTAELAIKDIQGQ